MSVVARMQVNEVASRVYGTIVTLNAVVAGSPDEPHAEEIKRFFAATPNAEFKATINNDAAAEQFQPGDQFYLTLERVKA